MKFSSIKCIALLSSVISVTLLYGCNSKETRPTEEIANPASKHCVNKGGKLKIAKEATGEMGMCHLPDGTIVEEWELFRRDNAQK